MVVVISLLFGGQVRAQAPAPSTTESCARGRELYRAGDQAAARLALLECLAESGDRVEILLPLTVMAVRSGDTAAAVNYGTRAVAAAPEDPEALYWSGRAQLAAGKPDAARALWETGLQLRTDHLGILEGMARLSLANGDGTRAYQFLMQMRQHGMDEPWLHRLLADIAAGKGLWQPALAHIQDALVIEPNQTADWLSASELSILAGQYDQAIGFCRRAVLITPDADSYGGLGEAFFAAEKIDSALVYLRRAVSLGDAKPRTRFNLANAMEVAGLVEEAGHWFRLFLDEVPDDSVGHFNYGIHLQKQGRANEALAQIDSAVKIDPDMLTARIVRVQLLEDLGRWDEALDAVEELKVRDSRNQTELAAWTRRLQDRRDVAHGARLEGKIHLLHMVLGDHEQLAAVTAELAKGADFASLVVQYSSGAAAARGGDIGWMRPEEMVEPLRSAIAKLQAGETSPPVESKGLIHLFKRIP